MTGERGRIESGPVRYARESLNAAAETAVFMAVCAGAMAIPVLAALNEQRFAQGLKAISERFGIKRN